MPAIKFCGLTRPEDAALAAELGARYAGVIFAGGPRNLSGERAAGVFAALPSSTLRVGVFGAMPPELLLDLAEELRLNVIQLHGEPDGVRIEAVRARFAGETWAVLRGNQVGREELAAIFQAADGVVMDGGAVGALGGTGEKFEWKKWSHLSDRNGAAAKLIVAGGLTHGNVAEVIRLLRPDVVDVSSGVETSPGIKDHPLMRSFADAVKATHGG